MPALSLTLDTPDLAAHYDRASLDRQFKTGRTLIANLEIRPGDRVLDVGSGTGLLAEYVAAIVGPSGAVHAVDPLPLRIEIAKRRTKPNLKFSVGDAFDLREFEDGAFDVVYLNAVFHWFPEKLTPLRNFHRLLARGGKLGISTGSKDHPNRIHGIQQEVLAREPFRAHSKSQQGLPHRVGADELEQLLDQAGFDLQSLDVQPNVHLHADAEAAIQHSQASSFGNLLAHLPESLRERARREVVTELERFRTAKGIRQDGARLVAVAVKR